MSPITAELKCPMEGEKLLMSQRQLQRLAVMGLVEAGKITLKEERKRWNSYRQTNGFGRGYKRKRERLVHGIREIRQPSDEGGDQSEGSTVIRRCTGV